ncbi:hypothetical protein [Pengzhenrongella sicca]|uniref:Uncharacterized protein n=1 Tax=Pengzhenrongella sicca TaxID=2819238 RepID=A0A8A4Z9I7_9MICO|nr:hypothetical protein [Pengzhenrongella sicca]QTE28091.1 hypothetical protein J4E96_11885 [Pengzhenrongella sicca]
MSRDVDRLLPEAARRHLEVLAGPPETYVESRPDAPWSDGADAMTVTIVKGATAHAVADVVGLNLDTLTETLPVEAAWPDAASPMQILTVPGAIAIAEPNGWFTARPEVVAQLSCLGLTVSLYWSVDHDSSFIVGDGGVVVRSFDPVIDRGQGGVGTPLPEEAGIDWSEPIGAAATVQARVTGIDLTRGQVFGMQHPTALMPWPR